MYDVIYVGAAIGFFAVMLVYVRLCQALAHRPENGDRPT